MNAAVEGADAVVTPAGDEGPTPAEAALFRDIAAVSDVPAYGVARDFHRLLCSNSLLFGDLEAIALCTPWEDLPEAHRDLMTSVMDIMLRTSGG